MDTIKSIANKSIKFNKKFQISDIWQIFLVIVLPIICVMGSSPYPYVVRPYLIYAVGIAFAVAFMLSGIKIKLNITNISAFLLICFMALQCLYSYDKEETIKYLGYYACAFTLLFMDLSENRLSRMITIMYVVCAVIALSILLSSIVDNCMLRYFSFVVNPNQSAAGINSITRELKMGAYSGLAREKGVAAYIMNVGIAILFSRYFANDRLKKSEWIFLIIFIVALMLTGKRTLFIISIACFAVFMLISKMHSKTFKVLSFMLIGGTFIFFSLMFVPKISNIISRFLDSENLETIGARDVLWNYLFKMIRSYWAFGAGFGSYNSYANNAGMEKGSEDWVYNGHNSYLQAFGELGIIGSAFLVMFAASALFITLIALKKVINLPKQASFCYFSIYLQLLILLYSLTGNPLYTSQIIFIWFMSIGIGLQIYRNYCTPKNKFGVTKVLRRPISSEK